MMGLLGDDSVDCICFFEYFVFDKLSAKHPESTLDVLNNFSDVVLNAREILVLGEYIVNALALVHCVIS
jgi:hypothetical protein